MTEYFTGNYKKVIQQQEGPRLTDVIINLEPRETLNFSHLAVGLVCFVLGMGLLAGIKACHKPPQPISRPCSECHNKFTSYFQNNGSGEPERMAYAVLQTKSPRLLASIAVVESNANPSVRNTGYKKRHHGAFQVNPQFHGAVSHNAVEQALQAERILEELTGEKKNIRTALNGYGGDTRGRYAEKILAELSRVP